MFFPNLGGQMAVLRDEKAKFGKDLLNANQTKKELENRLEEKNQLIEEMQAKMDSKQVNTCSFLNFFFSILKNVLNAIVIFLPCIFRKSLLHLV